MAPLTEHENVVIAADKHTMPYLDGRNPLMKKRLPYDALIETNLYDVNVHDYGPFGIKQFTKFVYRYVFFTNGRKSSKPFTDLSRNSRKLSGALG